MRQSASRYRSGKEFSDDGPSGSARRLRCSAFLTERAAVQTVRGRRCGSEKLISSARGGFDETMKDVSVYACFHIKTAILIAGHQWDLKSQMKPKSDGAGHLSGKQEHRGIVECHCDGMKRYLGGSESLRSTYIHAENRRLRKAGKSDICFLLKPWR